MIYDILGEKPLLMEGLSPCIAHSLSLYLSPIPGKTPEMEAVNDHLV